MLRGSLPTGSSARRVMFPPLCLKREIESDSVLTATTVAPSREEAIGAESARSRDDRS
jgi:hypothetical protein